MNLEKAIDALAGVARDLQNEALASEGEFTSAAYSERMILKPLQDVKSLMRDGLQAEAEAAAEKALTQIRTDLKDRIIVSQSEFTEEEYIETVLDPLLDEEPSARPGF